MAKVTINPAAQAPVGAEEAQPDNVVIDSKGRRLVIKQPDFLTESRIMRALGESAANQHYVLAYVMPAAMVVQIDGVEVPYPTTMQQIEGAISRLGREGMVAVLARIEEQAKAVHEASDDAAALKNS